MAESPTGWYKEKYEGALHPKFQLGMGARPHSASSDIHS